MTPAIPLDEATRELSATRYTPLSHLASGSFGDVFIVRHQDLGTELVLKLLKPEFKTHADVVERLKVEARIQTHLAHPNLVRVTDFGWARTGQPFLVTERLVGETLLDRIKRERSIPLAEALDLATQMLEGLAVVHEAKLVHRDIKPANLFLAKRPDGGVTLKLLDFGIAKILDPDEGPSFGRHIKTAEGMVLGTPAYLAPEQILGRPVDARTDLYAAAGVLYRMLAGRPMLVTESQDELILAQLQQVPDPVSAHAPIAIPPAIDAAVAKGLAKDPGERFQSARDFAAALKVTSTPRGLPKNTIPMRSQPAAAPLSRPALSPAELPSGFVFRGDGFEDGTIYATRPIEAPPQLAEPARGSPRAPRPTDSPAVVMDVPAKERGYPAFLVPVLLVAVGVLGLAVIALISLMVLR